MYEVLTVVAVVLAVAGAAIGLFVAAPKTGGPGDDQIAGRGASAPVKLAFAAPFLGGGAVFALVAIALSVLARG
ncbi:hypothetical protein Rhe02_16840 [Rhizocola hellebori]|uniref:Uncharacterized protein n=1 Tax=Rhizocola hellebori TaxID=1392758 RepID=A0A8J3Q542_9ACTN|nr:hypothetical protein [Rhizocola hellebori]GIH03617.1 hypothetical protein Rhe02_16840 [Rhizocola hellebori]